MGSRTFNDAVGYIDHPLYFYFEEGTNTIRLSGISEPLAIEYIRLYQHKSTTLC